MLGGGQPISFFSRKLTPEFAEKFFVGAVLALGKTVLAVLISPY